MLQRDSYNLENIAVTTFLKAINQVKVFRMLTSTDIKMFYTLNEGQKLKLKYTYTIKQLQTHIL